MRRAVGQSDAEPLTTLNNDDVCRLDVKGAELGLVVEGSLLRNDEEISA